MGCRRPLNIYLTLLVNRLTSISTERIKLQASRAQAVEGTLFLTILTPTVLCLHNRTLRVHSLNQSSRVIETWSKQQLVATEEPICMVRRPRYQQKPPTPMRPQTNSYKFGLARKNLRPERTQPEPKPSNSCKFSSKRLHSNNKLQPMRSCFQTSTVSLTIRSEARSDKELTRLSELECTRS